MRSTSTQLATKSPTANELYWAAGFIEGEGSFGKNKHSEIVTATQKEVDPLVQLLLMFGGTIALQHREANTFRDEADIYRWSVYGPRARGVMMTLYKLMSHRRKAQIVKSLWTR